MAEAADFTMSEAFASEMIEKINKNSTNSRNSDCILYTGRHKKNGYGVIDVKFPGKPRYVPIHVHRLVYMINVRLTKLTPPEYHVSHLCHTKDCVNFSHLTLEPQHVNNARQNCLSEKRCNKTHSPYPDCLI